jgi:hypothetical protein
MQYLLLIYVGDMNSGEAHFREIIREHKEFRRSIRDDRRYRDSRPLQPASTATTVRVRNAKTVTSDGPFIETKEQLGGYYLVEADNLDEAISMAARLPEAKEGAIEIRPVNMSLLGEDER